VCSYLRKIVHRSLLSLLTYIFTFPSPTFRIFSSPLPSPLANLSFLLPLSLSLSLVLLVHSFVHPSSISAPPSIRLSIYISIYLYICLSIYLSHFLRLLSSFSHLSHPRFPLLRLHSPCLSLSCFLFLHPSFLAFPSILPLFSSLRLGSCCFSILYGICRLRDAATSQECSRPVHLVHTCARTTYYSDLGSCLRARKARQRLIGSTRSE